MKINFSAQINKTQNALPYEQKAHTLYGDFLKPTKSVFNPDVYVRNPDVLKIALDNLNTLTFDKKDIEKVKRYGVRQIFQNGQQALDFAKNNNISIVFGNVQRPDIHAQWIYQTNTVIINDRYKNTRSMAEIYAISAALFHELSHAKDGDGVASIQEEIDCLGMNALAFNVFKKRNPRLFNSDSSPIIKDGVDLYTNLFLGNDEDALMKRIKLKYGDLPIESPYHKPAEFARRIAAMPF